jgi:hypothetical protein
LRAFALKMKQREVKAYLAHTPYVEVEGLDLNAVKNTSDNFGAIISSFISVLDSKPELIFKRDLFLDSDMHLNNTGRAVRTQLLIERLTQQTTEPITAGQ